MHLLIPTLQHGFPHSWLHLTRGDFAGQSWEEPHTYTHNFCDTQSAQTGGWSNIYKPTDEMKKYINRYINITVFLCFVMKVCKKEKKKRTNPQFSKKTQANKNNKKTKIIIKKPYKNKTPIPIPPHHLNGRQVPLTFDAPLSL